jgi:hypothetical protein
MVDKDTIMTPEESDECLQEHKQEKSSRLAELKKVLGL